MSPARRIAFHLAGCACLALHGCVVFAHEPISELSDAPGTAEHAVRVGNAIRTYLLHVPHTLHGRVHRSLNLNDRNG